MASTESTALPIGLRIVSGDGVGGTIKSDVNEHGNVLVHWDDGYRWWSQAALVRRRLLEANDGH